MLTQEKPCGNEHIEDEMRADALKVVLVDSANERSQVIASFQAALESRRLVVEKILKAVWGKC